MVDLTRKRADYRKFLLNSLTVCILYNEMMLPTKANELIVKQTVKQVLQP